MTDKTASVLQFDDCELDIASRELRRAGELVPLEPRVFALLVFLYEQRHRAVGKDEIQDSVWAGRMVSETALTRAIMKARRAVNDNADKQAVIRTVHGHGYQFVAAIAEAEIESETSAVEEPVAQAVDTRPARRLTTPRLLTALVVLLAGIFVITLWPDDEPEQSIRLAIMPVENASGDSEFEWARLGLMGFANELLIRGAVLNILSASDVIRFAEQNELSYEDSNAATVGRDLLTASYGASHMLMSKLEKSGGVLRLSYSLYHPGGEVDVGTMVGAEPTALMRGMIRSVIATLGPRVRAVDQITVVSEDPFINEAYSRGLSFSLEGRCGDALQLFELVTANGNSDGRAEYEWATCARILGRWQDAEAGFEKILADTPVEPASSLRAAALNGLGTVYIRTGRGDEAREIFKIGFSEAEAAGDFLLQSKLLNSLAIDAKNRREFDEARELIARAMVAHSEAGAGPLPGQLPAALANIDMGEGKFEQAEKHLQDALDAFRALGDRRNEAMMLNNFGYLRRQQGRSEEAEPLHLQSLEIRREIGDLVGQGRILGMLSTLYRNDGRLDKALEAATEAYRISSEANDRLFMATSLAQLAQVEHSAGDLIAARNDYAKSNAIFLQIEDYSRAAQTTLRIARLDLEAGDYAAAQESTQEVLDLANREALYEPVVEGLELSGDIARRELDLARAIAAYRDALDYIEESGFVARKSGIVTKLAHTLLDSNDPDGAEPLIGYLIEQGGTSTTLKLRARYAFIGRDTVRSVELMESAQTLAGDDWSEADSQVLAQYREALE